MFPHNIFSSPLNSQEKQFKHYKTKFNLKHDYVAYEKIRIANEKQTKRKHFP